MVENSISWPYFWNLSGSSRQMFGYLYILCCNQLLMDCKINQMWYPKPSSNQLNENIYLEKRTEFLFKPFETDGKSLNVTSAFCLCKKTAFCTDLLRWIKHRLVVCVRKLFFADLLRRTKHRRSKCSWSACTTWERTEVLHNFKKNHLTTMSAQKTLF